MIKFDLLTTIEYGGCSAKIAPDILDNLLASIKSSIPIGFDKSNLIVGFDTSDDAAVYKINDNQAIIFTTDFFPPLCSDPYTFGQIAATNAMSDVYAMGGNVLLALNLIMFPDKNIPFNVLTDILQGGQDKVIEAGGIIAGGHTINDYPPKYGLAVLGLVALDNIITNSNAKEGDVLLLTKPIGTGVILAGERLKLVDSENSTITIENMKLLNKEAASLMNKYNVKAATDITGFGLLGHAFKMAKASFVCLNINVNKVQFIPQTIDLIDYGCIPGACFRNRNYMENYLDVISNVNYNKKMALFDAQTSGGLLISVDEKKVESLLQELKKSYPCTTVVGTVEKYTGSYIKI